MTDDSNQTEQPPAPATMDQIARTHRLAAAVRHTPLLLDGLSDYEDVIESAYDHFRMRASGDAYVSYGAEWLLDNYYIVQRAAREIYEDMPRGFLRELPVLSAPEAEAGYPRIFSLAVHILAAADVSVTARSLSEMVAAYQEVEPLTIAELWALPTMLRLGLIATLGQAVVSDIKLDWSDRSPIGKLIALPAGASTQDIIAGAVQSIHVVERQDWAVFFEECSLVEQTLRADPVYGAMDFATRDRYRKVVQELAKHSSSTELEVASCAAELALNDIREDEPARHSHVGYYFLDSGRRDLESRLDYRASLVRNLGRWATARSTMLYLGAIAALSLLVLLGIGLYGRHVGAPAQLPAIIGLALAPVVSVAVAVVNELITRHCPPAILPKLDFSENVPADCRTMIVVPALLTGPAEVKQLLWQLEQHYLGNTDPQIRFGLLSDFADAHEESVPGDDTLLKQAISGIRQLNDRYGNEAQQPFYLFHRRRQWNPAEGAWMGWERKRGKLEEFNRLLRGAADTSYEDIVGQIPWLASVRYVITLDADTALPLGSGRRLIGALAHPLNQAEFDPDTGKLVAGYTILQPRTAINPVAAARTPFSRIFSGDTGIDLYTLAVSDVYQDLFGEGIFVGKGIYDVDAFMRTLQDRVPDNSLLSHDLFEGIHGRAALVSDIVLYEDYPAGYLAQSRRQHRWIRGDWQLLPWLGATVPSRTGGRTANVLSVLDRWKIVDNLRRSLLWPAVLLLLISGWLWLPGSPLFWSVLALAPLLMPPATGLLVWIVTWVRHRPGSGLFQELRYPFTRALLGIVFLPHTAYVALDAIARTLVRVYRTRRHLLEWTTAAQTARRLRRRTERGVTWLQMAETPLFALLLGGLLLRQAPAHLLPAAPFLLAWMLAPWIAGRISRAPAPMSPALSQSERQRLRNLALRTWLYFEHHVDPDDNWLPPDHYQESPLGVVAHRTSPTNIGLMLLATIAAYDFGYESVLSIAIRLQNSFETLDQLERRRGHFLNWYETRSLEPLPPRYISMVDSGNLAGCLVALQQSMVEIREQPILRWARWQGLCDSMSSLVDLLDEMGIRSAQEYTELRRTLTALIDEIEAAEHTQGQWIPTMLRINEYKMPELAGNLQTILAVHGHHVRPAHLHTLRILLNRINFQLNDMQRECERLAPWLQRFIQIPLLVRNYIKQDPSLQAEWDALQAHLGPSLSLAATPDACEQATPIAHTLRTQLLAVAEESEQATIARWCDELLAALESAPVAGRQVAQTLMDVARRSEAYVEEMDFSVLYSAKRDVFHIGFNVDTGTLDNNYYDLLASEARLGSFLAIAKHDIPVKHWLHLGRPLSAAENGRALLSWSGTMFEYLMPNLFMRLPKNTLLRRACDVAVAQQIDYGRKQNCPWGISESGYYHFDANRYYQYQAFGVPGLGFKRGLGEDLVVSSYASILALRLNPHAVVENLGRLTDMGMLGDYGLYEAVDYTAERLPPATDRAIVRSYMVHHQGMILLELLNYLEDDLMVDRFHSDPRVQNVEMLLHEQIPHAAPLEELGRESEAPQPALDPRISAEPWHLPAKTPTPQAHYLSNGGYSVLVTNGGGGFSRWHETDLTRWRADATLDDWGNWLYLRDETTGELWSMTVRPVADQRTDHAVHFAPHYAGFQSRRDSLAARMEIFVVPGDDVEIRRVRLSNQGDETRRLTLTSYAEVVLNDQRSDRRHPAFNKMFIESEHDAETDVLLFRRRPRSADEDPIFLAHGLALNGSLTRNGGYETDRARFLGRNGTVRSPQALTHAQGDLTGTTGATLDPIMAFSQRLDIGPNESVELAYLTAAASTREDARFLLHQYQRWTAIRRAEMESKSAAELEMRRLNMTSDALAQVQRLLSPLLYPSSAMRAPAATLAANRLGQPALWPLAISGDYPILLLRLQDDEGLALLQQVLRAHRYWRTRHLQISLVILNDEASGYVQELQGQVAHQIRRSDHSNYLNQRGGIFLLHRENLDEEALTLLESAARVVLDQKEGSLDAQLAQLDAHRTPLPLFEPSGNGGDELTVPPLSRPVDLRFDNGFGGFSPDGREYVIYRRPDQPTPAPWSNVIANPEFGFLMTERGSSFTWAVNSGENRLTPWSNDPVSDPSGEALYLRDEETGALWSPLPAPAGDDKPYLIRHGAGYSRFEHHSQGLIQTTTTFVPIDAPVKIVTLQLKNCASRVRRITATYYAEWVLGVNRDEMQQHIVPDYDNDTGALLARNAYHTEFGTRVAFLGASRPPHGVTTDRAEFLGRQGDYSRPDALTRMGLSGTVRAGVDPCAAYQVHLDIQPDEEVEVHFLLGQGGDRAAVQELLARYRDPAAVRSAWDDMTNFWDETLETVQVKTPDPALDLLLNRWLLYQNLACRVWGRSAFYQSSGAFGFRDQLQDVMALVHARPALARAHLLTAAAHQFETGDVLHWWHPPSGRGVRTRITDDLLWLPYVTAYYVERTGDLGVLDESIPFLTGSPLTFEEHERYDHYQSADAGGSLYEHCLRAIQRGSTAGKHGLPLMGGGDWNDGMNRVGIGGQGESVWLAWFLARTLTMFAPLCEHKDDAARAARFREDAADLQAAADEGAWDGAWYLRGFYDDGTPLGASTSRECRIDSIAQSWAVFASDPVTDRAHAAMQAVAEQLVDEENELIRLFRPPFDQTTRDPGYIKGYPPGIRENGGQYTHAALWTIWAFAELGDGARATDLFRLINPIHHGGDSTRITNYRVEPYVVAADVYADSGHEGRGGWSWYTGSAGWMYRLGIEGILGVQRMGDRLRIAPCISPDWPELTVTLRCGAGTTYCIHIRNPDGVSRGVREITVDGAKQETGIVPLIDDGTRHAVRVLLGSSPRKEGHDEGSRQ